MSSLRFERSDPEQPPASELLAEMRVELNDVYESFNRLDNPSLVPDELATPMARTSWGLREPRWLPAAVSGDWTTAWRRSSGCSSARRPDRVA